ncbi:helix-turn-helix domain-containing protein [Lactonifactor sp. BIOML-A3]|uniref:helix-turn-helix domain-containing protein n=1 Tax=unclassified Lactonifactor TaxID=2636670 RepID=UPI0012B0389B|nr:MULTISPECIES: helix-turn-helix transcriptional regulator [unclassified Lactonifactor]MSA02899.1 helix-turn-helix domain-containing protein [Lactonifactor sp. BIOML-A5]MSA10258.1 helix-turn-helix domain-containing protein [Lactonifactor sp. BIOML-A4]MSA13546.1 helix-turn-helix domain-containing protein [Lactonifactor sp. BIOML-A3]MSA19231.1 helix-turn-helix domain-containing protein [Lactonifactor sp. BIOML-A2]MSA39100.1 helix-turn-helix domain-containing protein [Lactonifactor sp. BIOML-A1]
MSFYEKLKAARKAAGLTQKQFADMLGVYQKDISRWETGEVSPSIETLKEICIQLKTSADELLELK